MIVAIDCEYVAPSAVAGEVPGVRPDVRTEYCEIMQIGACKVGRDGNELGVLEIVVLPHLIYEIPSWLSAMTGMTRERRVREGVPFAEALQRLADFVNGETPWVFQGDEHVLRGNAHAQKIEMPFTGPFLRAKQFLLEMGITLEDYQRKGFAEMNSGHLYSVLGIELPVIEGVGAHNAVHDARSLAHSMYYLLRRR